MSSLYLLLIAVIVLFSWVGSIYALTLPDGSMIPNLLSEESVRWFVRHSIDNVSAAPLVEALLALIAIGALRSSGLLTALIHYTSLDVRRHRHALYTALAVLAVCLCLVLMGIAPGGNLLSVTGHIAGGPFASGWLFLLTLVASVPSIVYGCMSGQWRNAKELFAGLSSEIASCASYFVTIVVASQLVAVMQYVRLFELLGISYAMQSIIVALVYAIPFIFLIVTNTSVNESSSIE